MHRRHVMSVYWGISGAALALAVAMVALFAPTEATMGPVQKIFYLHLPTAVCMFGACIAVFAGNVAYIWQRHERWERLSLSAARAAVVLSSIVLGTGMLWGQAAWGHWWTWSPRLTFSLILWLLYVVYLLIHRSLEPGARRDVISAMYGIVAFMDVPLVYLSVKLLPDIHPRTVELEPAMRWTLLACMVPAAMITGGFIATSFLGRRLVENRIGPAAGATPV